jgi:adenylate cyclase
MRMLSLTIDLLQADRFSCFVHNKTTDMLEAVLFDAKSVDEEGEFAKIQFPSNEGIAGYVFSTGDAINIPDAYKDSRFNQTIDQQTGYRTRSILCCPVKYDGETYGVMQVINKREGTFTDEDENLLRLFGEQCVSALEATRSKSHLPPGETTRTLP